MPSNGKISDERSDRSDYEVAGMGMLKQAIQQGRK